MGKQLVLAGGGHAHMMLLANIYKIIASGHSVTVIQPSDYHYYSGMGPGMLSGFYSVDEIRFHTRFVVERQGGIFFRDKVVKIDADNQFITLESGKNVTYDVLSCNTGSFVPFQAIDGYSDTIFSAKPIERLLTAQEKIISLCNSDAISIAVVGGGPAAIEIAGAAHQLAKNTGCQQVQVKLFAGKKLMNNFPDRIGQLLRMSFAKRKIVINESGYVRTITDGTIIMENGAEHKPNLIFLATGVQPSTLFEHSGLPTGPKGGLRVNAHLQCINHDNIFGGGDCIHFSSQPLNKVGVYAVRENPVLLTNILAALEGRDLIQFDPGAGYLLVFNLGDGTGILQKGSFFWEGKLSFLLKDFIDRRFMRKFQAPET